VVWFLIQITQVRFYSYQLKIYNMFLSVNPATEEVVSSHPAHSMNEVKEIVASVDKAWQYWKETPFMQRAAAMQKVAEHMLSCREELAVLMVKEMGKPIVQARAEVDKCIWVCRYYAENAESFLQPEYITTGATKSYISWQPLGIVLAVMPWNFPLWQVFRFAAPALMAGNAALLKHASNVMGCAMAIEAIFRDAGFPVNIFRSLKIKGEQVADVIALPAVKAITLTGSVGAGSAVAQAAGRHIKKTVLELGGSDAYIILYDADLHQAAIVCAASRLLNGGQSCIAAKRFIVVEKVYDAFCELFLQQMQEKIMGDPMDDHSDLGPQAQVSLRNELHQQVKESIAKGARCLVGGEIPERKGAWYPPTVLADVKPGMPAYHEELFGPVAALIKARDEEDAIRIANDSPFGLGCAVFTSDAVRGQHIAEYRINAGCCFVNEMVKSDPRLPFGGIGHSGYGRELSWQGIREFMNMKTVYVK
jgi:succinate-semialdehyde dehydrogenase / glutarate-semialdehyde dehydrogenase